MVTVLGSSSSISVVAFDAAGHQLAIGYCRAASWTGWSCASRRAGRTMLASSHNNVTYDPIAEKGTNGSYKGAYTLTVSQVSAGSASVSSISGASASGTAARSSLPSANVGQTITLTGVGFLPGDQVVFEYVDLEQQALPAQGRRWTHVGGIRWQELVQVVAN